MNAPFGVPWVAWQAVIGVAAGQPRRRRIPAYVHCRPLPLKRWLGSQSTRRGIGFRVEGLEPTLRNCLVAPVTRYPMPSTRLRKVCFRRRDIVARV
jgi:hypothetical protein